jgi:NAD(P)-dependent dehydrogenase (short-subunit alcohol dehydrogenase family)
MKHDFSGKTIMVTGGTGALGKALTAAFKKSQPKSIVITYRSEKERQESETELSNLHDQSFGSPIGIEYVKTDITIEEEVQKLISKIMDKHGQIHILANVVGGYLGGKSITDISESEWDKMFNVNLKSAFLISKHVLPVMVSNQYGKIVHVSSVAGIRSIGYDSAYAASKAGLIRLVESASQEAKKSNVNINCILPTIIDTKANREAMPNADFSRWIDPTDLANVILFLCSDDSKIINGSSIPTYGSL